MSGLLARLRRVQEAARGSLGFLPAVGVGLALLVGLVLPEVERGQGASPLAGFAFGGGPAAARSVLSSIAGSVITVTSLTFSLTIVTLQLASSQFSPRLLRTFVRDRVVQSVLAVFLATFVYALVVLRTIRSDVAEISRFVPRISVTLAIVLALVSAGALVTFVAHIAALMRVDTLMRDVHSQTRRALDALYPTGERQSGAPPSPAGRHTVALTARRSGWVQGVDAAGLCTAARAAGVVLVLDVGVGDHVIARAPVGSAWRDLPDADPLRDADSRVEVDLDALVDGRLSIGYERTPQFDTAFGIRQLVDIAARALSPGINDPTTAVHALGHLAALLSEMADRPLGPLVLSDDDGRVRVVVRRPGFPELLDLSCDQVRQFGAGQPAVVVALLGVLAAVARRIGLGDPGRRAAVARQLEMLLDAADRETPDGRDLVQARQLASDVRALLGAALVPGEPVPRLTGATAPGRAGPAPAGADGRG